MMTEVHFPAGVAAPLRVRAVKEEMFHGQAIFSYEITPSTHQGRLAREAAGLTESDQATAIQIKVASRQPIEGLGVGRYYTVVLVEHEPIPSPDDGRGEGMMGLLKAIFGDARVMPLGDLLGKGILEAACQACGETFNPADESDTTHAVRADGEPCGGMGVITGRWVAP